MQVASTYEFIWRGREDLGLTSGPELNKGKELAKLGSHQANQDESLEGLGVVSYILDIQRKVSCVSTA